MGETDALRRFLAGEDSAVRVTIAEARGSTPRDTGTWMLVTRTDTFGTIGGGQLEFMAIDRARQDLKSGGTAEAVAMDVPLGPDIGQCCGGRVTVRFEPVTPAVRDDLMKQVSTADLAAPHIYLFGAGHVGDAIARALAPLPCRTILADTRPDALTPLDGVVETRLVALPEALVAEAPAGSAFVILTHDHALDFLIAQRALDRSDAAYVGMIGSKTKRATFANWHKRGGGDVAALDRLVCPIGGSDVDDKRPSVIAALVAAELVRALYHAVDKTIRMAVP